MPGSGALLEPGESHYEPGRRKYSRGDDGPRSLGSSAFGGVAGGAWLGGDGELKLYEPLSTPHYSARGRPGPVLGRARAAEAALAQAWRFARGHGLETFVMGRGSNLLVRDGGIAGLVIHRPGAISRAWKSSPQM